MSGLELRKKVFYGKKKSPMLCMEGKFDHYVIINKCLRFHDLIKQQNIHPF